MYFRKEHFISAGIWPIPLAPLDFIRIESLPFRFSGLAPAAKKKKVRRKSSESDTLVQSPKSPVTPATPNPTSNASIVNPSSNVSSVHSGESIAAVNPFMLDDALADNAATVSKSHYFYRVQTIVICCNISFCSSTFIVDRHGLYLQYGVYNGYLTVIRKYQKISHQAPEIVMAP